MTTIELAATATSARRLHAVAPDEQPVDGGIDRAGAIAAVETLLVALGRDPASTHLAETPRRVADALIELLTPQPFAATMFANDEHYDELVVVADIPFSSLCEHHLLPFRGVAHVGYVPGDRLVGLSKLARVVELFARDLQVQERMTRQIADWIERDPRAASASAWCSRPNTSACRCAACRSRARARSRVRSSARCAMTIARAGSSSPAAGCAERGRDMDSSSGLVIVGGGLAGARAAEGAREAGYDGSVTIIAGEGALPYIRPPLSKEFLIGTDDRDSIDVHPRRGTPSSGSRCCAAAGPPRSSPTPTRSRSAMARCWATTGCCSRPGRRPDDSAGRAPTSRACTCCAPSTTRSPCARPSRRAAAAS